MKCAGDFTRWVMDHTIGVPCSQLEMIEQLEQELFAERQKRLALEALLPAHDLESHYAEVEDSVPKTSRHRRQMCRSTIIGTAVRRASVLIILLLLQSISSSVLNHYEDLVHHSIVPLFLTMLVGAGGNAGNQATVRSISGLVSGEYRPFKVDFVRVVKREVAIGFIGACLLTAIGFLRVYWFTGGIGGLLPVYAVSFSLFLIVTTSAIIGSALPFLLTFAGMDAEHAGPAIQVIMDILGVLITCTTTQRFLSLDKTLIPTILADDHTL
eukprot:GGOE01020668.1.p1 GENE.GGOE01020668.1~~GGOE01020668.1.p1  ORF type:complete len:269 (+),score=96.61 GGOE01020668.1:62-868(+)